MIKVSIITVCFNSDKTIMRTIESVLQQTYMNIEYIIIDGSSTDQTMNIVKEYEPKFMGRMKWVSEPDNGIYYAMNKGLALASGEIIGILNSDDFYELQAVEHVVAARTRAYYQIMYGFMRSWKDGREYSISRQSHYFLDTVMINHPSCFVTKSIYDDFGAFDTKYVSVSDYDFMLRMSRNDKIVFTMIDKLLANFSLGGMCGSDRAWKDLLKLKKNYSFISGRKYYWEICKSGSFQLIGKLFCKESGK